MKKKLKFFEKNSIPLIINNNTNHKVKYNSYIKEKQDFSVNFLNNQFSPAIKQWVNGIYNFNKNFIKNIPATDLIVNKIINTYFSINPLIINPEGKKTRLLVRRYKRLSLNTIIVSEPEIKHNNDNVFITVFLYNKRKKSILFNIRYLYSKLNVLNKKNKVDYGNKRRINKYKDLELNKKLTYKGFGLKKNDLSIKRLFYIALHRSNALKKPFRAPWGALKESSNNNKFIPLEYIPSLKNNNLKKSNKKIINLKSENFSSVKPLSYFKKKSKLSNVAFKDVLKTNRPLDFKFNNIMDVNPAEYNIVLDNKAKLSNITYYILSLKNLNSICKMPLNKKINIKYSSLKLNNINFNEKNQSDWIRGVAFKTLKKKLIILGNTIIRGYDYNYETMFNNINTIALINKMFNNKVKDNNNIYGQLPLNTLFLNPIVKINKKRLGSTLKSIYFRHKLYLRKKYLYKNKNNYVDYNTLKNLTKNNINKFLVKYNNIILPLKENNKANYTNVKKNLINHKVIKQYYISLNKYKIINDTPVYLSNANSTMKNFWGLYFPGNKNNNTRNNNELTVIDNISRKLINKYICNILKNGISEIYINVKFKSYTTKFINYPKIKNIFKNNGIKFNINFLSKFNYIKSSHIPESTKGLLNKPLYRNNVKTNNFFKTNSVSLNLLQKKKIDFLQPFLKNTKNNEIIDKIINRDYCINKKFYNKHTKSQLNYFNVMQYKYNYLNYNFPFKNLNTKNHLTMYKLKTLYNIFSIYNSNLRILEFKNKFKGIPVYPKYDPNNFSYNKSLINISDLLSNTLIKQTHNYSTMYYNEIIWNTYNLLNKSKNLTAYKTTKKCNNVLIENKSKNLSTLKIQTINHNKYINSYIKTRNTKNLNMVFGFKSLKPRKFSSNKNKFKNKPNNMRFNIYQGINDFLNKYNSILISQNTIYNENFDQKNIADTSTSVNYLSTLTNHIYSRQGNTLAKNNLENKYILEYIKEFFYKDLLYLYYLKLLSYNDIIFKNWFLNMLIIILSKLYNKKVIINLISLKYLYLNSDIFMQAIITRLKNIEKYLPKYIIPKALSLVNLGVIKPTFYKSQIYNNKFNNSDIKQNFSKNPTIFNFLYLNNNYNFKNQNQILNNVPSLYLKNSINSGIYKNVYNLDYIHPNIINFIKYKAVFGVKLVTSGRLTRRSTASKAVFKINFKGSMKNNLDLNRSNSNTILRNSRTSNLQFTKISSKTRNGSFGIKGWINNS